VAGEKQRPVHPCAFAALAIALLIACGRGERHSQAPRRVITLTPSATEMVAAIGAEELLVGVDDYSTYPAGVKDLPKVGAFLTPNMEAIIRLDPDLVITDDIHEEVAAALRDAGIDAMVVDIHTLEDVRDGLERISARLGRAEAGRDAIARIDAAVDAAAARKHRPAPRVLAVIDHARNELGDIYAAGPGSWIDELLAIEGASNVLASSGVRYPKINAEEILRGAPDVIIDVTFGVDQANAERAWAEVGQVPAVRNHRVVALGAPYMLAPSPRVDQALADLDAALYPVRD
jgi:iron complex transport system substrate-binding protein